MIAYFRNRSLKVYNLNLRHISEFYYWRMSQCGIRTALLLNRSTAKQS